MSTIFFNPSKKNKKQEYFLKGSDNMKHIKSIDLSPHTTQKDIKPLRRAPKKEIYDASHTVGCDADTINLRPTHINDGNIF